MKSDFTAFQIDLLVPPDDNSFLQVDDTIGTKGRYRLAGFRIQGNKPVADRYIKDALVSPAVCPVGNATSRKFPRSGLCARSFIHAVDPLQFARLRIQ